jgi:hypothetical protein
MRTHALIFFLLATISSWGAQPQASSTTNEAWLNASKLVTGHVPSGVLGTNTTAPDFQILIKTGNKTKWADGADLNTNVATTFPSIIVTNGMTNLSLTANTITKSDANQKPASVANASGALTNNGSGVFGWYSHYTPDSRTITINGTSGQIVSSAGAQDFTGNISVTLTLPSNVPHLANGTGALTNDGAGNFDYYNAFATKPSANAFTGSNFFNVAITFSTNQNQIVPDFSLPEQLISTNAAFTFLAPVGVDTTKKTVQWTLVNVTNTTAAAVAITAPANVHPVGTAFVTNWTLCYFQCYAQKITNLFFVPVF